MVTQDHTLMLLLYRLVGVSFVTANTSRAAHFWLVASSTIVVIEALTFLFVVSLVCLSEFETYILSVLLASTVLV